MSVNQVSQYEIKTSRAAYVENLLTERLKLFNQEDLGMPQIESLAGPRGSQGYPPRPPQVELAFTNLRKAKSRKKLWAGLMS